MVQDAWWRPPLTQGLGKGSLTNKNKSAKLWILFEQGDWGLAVWSRFSYLLI